MIPITLHLPVDVVESMEDIVRKRGLPVAKRLSWLM